jgi:coenzyme F420 hydrogenase subunit beta
MKLPILTIKDVTEKQLCTGCGICAALESERFVMGEDIDVGRRPFLRENAAEENGDALKCCPGAMLEHDFDEDSPELIKSLRPGWGPVLNVWEAHASDEKTRFSGSSGGAATALATFCLEQMDIDYVVHVGSRKDTPYLNQTVMSRTRAELISRSGSRYAPASPCDILKEVEDGPGNCVFIGKPCDVAAVHKARQIRPELARKIKCTIAFFCAGVPSTRGTLKLMEKVGVKDPSTVESLKYRGQGWPGMWKVVHNDGTEQTKELTYAESWGYLQRYRQWRCYICPDHTGEFADIAVGDPWYRDIEPGESGSSLIVARTENGRSIVNAAIKSDYIKMLKSDPTLLPRSQPNLLHTRGGLWMRLIVLRLLGAAVPKYPGFSLFRYWRSELSFIDKIRSFTGTAKRVFRKKLRKPMRLRNWSPSSDEHASD